MPEFGACELYCVGGNEELIIIRREAGPAIGCRIQVFQGLVAEYVFGDYVMWVGFICVDLLVSVGDASEEDVGTSYRFVIREFHFKGGRQAGRAPVITPSRD